MPNKLHRLVLIFFPAIFLLINQAECYASEAQDAANSALQVNKEISDELTPPGQNAGPQPPYIQFKSVWDIYEALALLSGVFLSALGLAIIALSFLRWKKKDLLLISTGVFCFLYGARSRAFLFIFQPSPEIWDYAEWFITYLVLIPAFFFVEQLLGKGWKSSIRLLWQISIVFAILAIAVGIYLRNPAAASTINNIWAGTALVVILINLFKPSRLPKMELRVIRSGFLVLALFSFHANFAHYVIKGPLGRNYEPIGLVVLFGCLGYLVANRFFQNEKELITLAHELETARQIQSFILPQEMEKIPPWEQFKTFISSNSQLSGNDFADRLIKAVSDWSGKGAKDNLDDDLTLIVIDCENLGNDIT